MARYIKSLDGLRGLAILMVFCFHLNHFSYGRFFDLKFGWVGVQMFFVLSGYLITQILLNEKHKDFGKYIGKFYWRRILRIFPIYFTYISFFAFLYLLTHHPKGFNQHAPFLFTYTYNFTRLINGFKADPFFIHLWSLSVEEQFYLIWPLCIYFLSARHLKVFVLVLVFGVPVFRYLLYDILVRSNLDPASIGEAIYGFTISHFDAFAFGGAIPVFNLEKRKFPVKSIFWLSLAVLLIAGGINLYLMAGKGLKPSAFSLGYPIGSLENGQFIWSYTLMNICFGALTLYLLKRSYHGVFSNKFLVYTGKISYGMYLYHFAVLMSVDKLYQLFPRYGLLYSVLSLAATYTISYLSYEFYERKFLVLKDKYFMHSPAGLGRPEI